MRHEFSTAVRASALGRAAYRCERCSYKQDLELHHIGNPADNSLFNCLVLCTACHQKCHEKEHGKNIKFQTLGPKGKP